MQGLVAALALVVAGQYAVIAVYVVPRLARLADRPGLSGLRVAQWGAASFFLGCSITHAGIAVHTLSEPGHADSHLLLVHVWPHLAQVAGGAAFLFIAARRLEIRFNVRGYEARRRAAVDEQARAAAQLAQRAREQAAVAALGTQALATDDPVAVTQRAVRMVAELLDVDRTAALEFGAGDQFTVVAAHGWSEDIAGVVFPAHDGSPSAAAIRGERPVRLDELPDDAHDRLRQEGIRSSVYVPIGGRVRPWGTLVAHSRTPRRFTDHDVNVLTSIAHVVAAAADRSATEQERLRQALEDPVTGLPNRVRFLDRLDHALAGVARRPASVAVLYLDLDNFKTINDTLGHSAGDQLLRAAAERLTTSTRPSDTLARLGGDEFAIVCEDVSGREDVEVLARRIGQVLDQPFVIDGSEHRVSASIGIAIADDPRLDGETLLRFADIAMYRAKEDRSGFAVFDQGLRQRTTRRMETETALANALAHGQLRLAYQPIVRLPDRKVVAVEALLRWEHPELGNIPPSTFIPLAERSGAIVALGAWALHEAGTFLARSGQDGPDRIPACVSVNASAHQLARGRFVEDVHSALQTTGIAPAQLAIELTETVLLDRSPKVMQTLEALRAMGVRIVLDDFGIGYSSLSYLSDFALDGLKIDRSFIRGLDERHANRAILSAVIGLAAELDLDVTAEGIETEHQARAIADLGCRRAQGYLFGRPTAAAAYAEPVAPR
jgi:diguanylate cyclase (GGDEF)-like protein